MAAFALPPLLFAAVAVAFFVVRHPPRQLFGWSLVLLLGAALAWILISVLWPARAERTCPGCAEHTLERLDPGNTLGLACARCGWQDETRSSWLLAEEEGPLEQIVLAARGRSPSGPSEPPGEREHGGSGEALRGREAGAKALRSTLDSPPSPD